MAIQKLNYLKKISPLIIAWGLILEFPIRYFLSPDPWIHNNEHWYFIQPSRLLIEFGFVLLAILPFLIFRELRNLLSIKWTRDNVLYLIFGITIPVVIFTLQQWEELLEIKRNSLLHYVPIWFFTGMLIGIGQELTFRGLIFTGLKNKCGVKLAAIISSLIFVFGSIHSPRLYAYLINDYVLEVLILVLVFFFSGLFFVWLRVKTNNIIIPALAHGIGNAITWFTFVIVKLYMN